MNVSPWSSSSSPRIKVLSEQDFRQRLVPQATTLIPLVNATFESSPEEWSQRQLEHISQAALELEQFLDDFGARENKTFFRTREIVAYLRWLSHAMGGYVHLHSRLPFYQHADKGMVNQVLSPTVRDAALQLGAMLVECAQRLRAEWLGLDLEWQAGVVRVDSLLPQEGKLMLSRNRGDQGGGAGADAPRVARFAARFKRFCEGWGEVAKEPIEDPKKQAQFLEKHASEAIARRFESRAHNLQSEYDTLLAGSPDEALHGTLPSLRAALSEALHLLEAVTSLVHLYERHESRERRSDSRQLFESLISPTELMDIIVNKGVVLAFECMRAAVPNAEAILEKVVSNDVLCCPIPPGVTLHARPMSLIVRVVAHHGTPVEMTIKEEKANAASIMALLVLAGSAAHAQEVSFSGDKVVLDDLKVLFDCNLGEGGLDELHSKLPYLANG